MIQGCVQFLAKRLSAKSAHSSGMPEMIRSQIDDVLHFAGHIIIQFANFERYFPRLGF